MNPARLHALYNAYFQPQRRPPESFRPKQQEEVKSLSAYLLGGL